MTVRSSLDGVDADQYFEADESTYCSRSTMKGELIRNEYESTHCSVYCIQRRIAVVVPPNESPFRCRKSLFVVVILILTINNARGLN